MPNETTPTASTHCLVRRQNLVNIANAIRGKTGSDDPITLGDFASEISGISTGTTPEGTINITQNGTDIDVSSYAAANVAVPPIQKGMVFDKIETIDNRSCATRLTTYGYTDDFPQGSFSLGIYNTAMILRYVKEIIFNEGMTSFPANTTGDWDRLISVTFPSTLTQIYGANWGYIETYEVPNVNSFQIIGGQTIKNTLKHIYIHGDVVWAANVFSGRYDSVISVRVGGQVNAMHNIFNYNPATATTPCVTMLYDFSGCDTVPAMSAVANLPHADGCVIRVKQSHLADFQIATNWCDLPTDPNTSGYVVWEGV